METPEEVQPQDDAADAPAEEPVGPAAATAPRPGMDADEIRNRLNSATSDIENSAAAARARGWVAPLEKFGRQPIAMIGALLVFVGIWMPVKTYSVGAGVYSIGVSWNLWDLNSLWAIVLILLCAATAFIAFARDYRLLWPAAAAIGVVEVVNLVFTFSGVDGVSAHPSWGWIFLILGLLGILTAAVMRGNPDEPHGDAIAHLQKLTSGGK